MEFNSGLKGLNPFGKIVSLLHVVFVKLWHVSDVVCTGMYKVSLDNYVWWA